MIARLAIIKRYNAIIQLLITQSKHWRMYIQWTNHTRSSLPLCSLFHLNSRAFPGIHCGCIKQSKPTVLFSLPVLDIRQFVYFNSYKDFNLTFLTLRTKKLRRVESRRGGTRRDETGRDGTRRDVAGRGGTWRLLRASDVSQSGLLIISVQVWAWFRCGRGVRPWVRDEVHTVG
jgi:hypothetical protein